MDIRDCLNDFEKDWAGAPVFDKKSRCDLLKNKTIYIAGGQDFFARYLVFSFFMANDVENLGIKICLLGKDSNALTGFIPALLRREDFSFTTIDTFLKSEKAKKGDLFIFTGFCNMQLRKDTEILLDQFEFVRKVLSCAKKAQVKKFVLLSDYRVYGEVPKGVMISEYEQSYSNFGTVASFAAEILKTVESYVVSFAHQCGFEYLILRTGMILSASADFDRNDITDTLRAVAQGKPCNLLSSFKKYSFVYLGDVLRSVYYALSVFRPNTAYNIKGLRSDVSTGVLAAWLFDLFPDTTKINLQFSDTDPEYGVQLNHQKAFGYGFRSEVSLQNALQMIIRNYQGVTESFVFDDAYQGKLKTIQNILLGYLLEADRICKKHNIKYFLAGGTLLGAIRHGGFIPWDDDADIMMLREDYEKFLKVVKKEIPSNLFLQNYETDKLSHNAFTKLRINNTMFATKATAKQLDMHNGIFFDILAHDQTANSKIGQKIHLYLTILARSLVFNKWTKRKISNGNKVQSAIANMLKKMFPISVHEFFQNKMLTLFKNKKNAKYLYDGMGRNIYKGEFPKEWLNESIEWEFEGHMLPVPKEYDKYLTYLYGDYKSLVPASKRKQSHTIVMMDLGEYSQYEIKED